METTLGKLLLKSALPKSLHHFADETLDKKGIGNLFATLAEKHPDTFNHVASELTRMGFEAATKQGSSVSLEDLKSPVDKNKVFDEIDKQVEEIKKQKLGKVAEKEKIQDIYQTHISQMDKELMSEGIKNNKTLAKMISAGARGSVAQYRATVSSPGIILDNDDIPFTEFGIRRSFSEGLTLPQYLASSYGARKSEVAKKLSTAAGGFFSKQLVRSSISVICEEHDCGTENGVPFKVSDKDSIGAFLAKPTLGYKRNNEITPEMLADLSNRKVNTIVVRSPLTCQASKKFHSSAVCQMCLGNRENGLTPVGSYVGVVAASSISEPLSQSIIGNKHSAGSTNKGSGIQGFALINQLANIPKQFPGEAVVSDQNGEVTEIKKADVGGHYLKINQKEYYVNPGFDIFVKKGQKVEKGDVLTDGIVNPHSIVEHKGIGEGRKHYVETMFNAFKNAGIPVNRRNFEIIAKNAIDHVKVTNNKGLGDFLPDQITSYQNIEKTYKPRDNSKLVRIDQAIGKYLETPVLHFTIGTPISNSVITQLKDNGIESINVNDNPPGFEPNMVRLLDVPENEDDMMGQLYSNYIEKRLVNMVSTGLHSSSDLKGPNPIAGIAYGKDFSKPN